MFEFFNLGESFMSDKNIGQSAGLVRRELLKGQWAEDSKSIKIEPYDASQSGRIVQWDINPQDALLEESNDACGCS